MEINADKLKTILGSLMKSTPIIYSNSQSIAIGHMDGRVVVLTVMSESYAIEDNILINPSFSCIEAQP